LGAGLDIDLGLGLIGDGTGTPGTENPGTETPGTDPGDGNTGGVGTVDPGTENPGTGTNNPGTGNGSGTGNSTSGTNTGNGNTTGGNNGTTGTSNILVAAAGSTAIGGAIAADTTPRSTSGQGRTALANTGMDASLVPLALLLLAAGLLMLRKRRVS